MFNITNFLSQGLRNSILVKNNGTFSYNGPWKQVYTDTQVSRWHHGEFSSAEFTISVDYDTSNKEIIKCLVCNGVDTASHSVYGRNNLGNELVNLSTVITDSYIDLIINPKAGYEGAKFIYSANYYHNQTSLVR